MKECRLVYSQDQLDALLARLDQTELGQYPAIIAVLLAFVRDPANWHSLREGEDGASGWGARA